MKIAFITSCLEPGRDGVGDYTALLAGECERRGHDVRLLALNDPHVDDSGVSAGQMRLSSALPWPARVEKAADLLSIFAPDFVSLQFVCYGFHPRGIDFGLAARLRKIIGACPVQIMFHELWIGAGLGAPLKDRFVGALQRSCVRRLLGALNVRSVHTSNAAYVAMLGAQKIDASLLPLFGAVPVPPAAPEPREPGDAPAFGIFGSLHPAWQPEPLFSLLRKTGKKIAVIHIGRMGAGAPLWEKLRRDYAGAIEFKQTGELPAEKIAQIFGSDIDFGIATTPWELIGKSASVAAMLEHGLPVIVSRDDWHSRNGAAAPDSPLLAKMDETLPEKISTMRRAAPESRLPGIASRFLDALERTA